MEFQFRVEEIGEKDKTEISEFFKNAWGSDKVVSRGKLHSYKNLEGFFVKENRKLIGIANYQIENGEMELVSLYCLIKKRGIGTALVEKVIGKAKQKNCKRLLAIVTNDNLKAMRFYQKLGFEICALHKNAVEESRKLKSKIPLTGADKILIKHEIEFELKF
ncbi:MAG: GNAT family N-acetyltransferase [Calditrichaeota bacterium]|nr:MAG: GNAT family N-acetyltransferase [Calditrichota bacterium]